MLSTCFSLRAARRLSGSPAVGGCHAADMRHAPWDTRATDPCVRSSVSRVTSHWHGEVNPVRTSEVPVLEFAPFIYINIHWSSRSMARLLPLALALCGSAFCATPEPEAPAYSHVRPLRSADVKKYAPLFGCRKLRNGALHSALHSALRWRLAKKYAPPAFP